MGRKKLEIGDRITFKAATRFDCKKATRKVTGLWFGTGEPTVHYNGWNDFVVYWYEIIKIERKEK